MAAPGAPTSPAPPAALSSQAQDAIKALETLGYRHEDARRAVEAVLAESTGQEPPAATLIRRALAHFRG